METMPIGGFFHIPEPDGTFVQCKSFLVYLGGLVDATGKFHPELNRGLGAARADFKSFERVGKHSCITPQRKIQIFDACVGSQLLYCLHTAWLNKAELRIPHTLVSRVSNCNAFHAA